MSVLSDLGASNAAIAARTLASATGLTYVNDFYDGVHATGPTGASRPLGTGTGNLGYATLGAAQADYPAAEALTDEVDWCAWKACADYTYTSLGGKDGRAHVIADGQYVVNKTIPWNIPAIWVEGAKPNQRYGGTKITYNGSGGTIDANVWIFDFYTFDEQSPAQAAPGRAFESAYGGPKVILEHIAFYGRGGSHSTTDQSANHGYCSAVRMRRGAFFQVSNCSFEGYLYDGIVFTSDQLFVIIERSWFGNVNRDGIVQWRCEPGNNSTTQWIYNNEFIGPRRYAIFLDNSGGAVQSMPIIRDNSFENGTTASFYYLNPEWNCQGVISPVCIIAGTQLVFDANRFEGWDSVPNAYCQVHLIDCDAAKISNSTLGTGVVVSSRQGNDFTTDAFDTLYATNRYCDVTDQRNYNIGHTAHPGINTENLVFEHNYNFNIVWYPDNLGGAATLTNSVRDQSMMVMGVPTKAGAYARVITPAEQTIPTLLTGLGIANYSNTALSSPSGARYFSQSGFGWAAYRWLNLTAQKWAAASAYSNKAIYGRYLFIRPTDANETGYFYQCTTAGTSHASTEPTWPTTIGSTVSDGTVVWTCVGREPLVSEVNRAEQLDITGKRVISGTAAPTTGIWAVGDKTINSSPSAGGAPGWECTTAGTPGTWKAMASLAA